MPDSTYEKIRKERCPDGCGAGLPLCYGARYHAMRDIDGNGEELVRCTAPSPAQIIEEQAAEIAGLTRQFAEEKARVGAYRENVQSWIDAYPEEGIFGRLPPASTESKELQAYRTKASAAMGRHMGRCLLRQFDEIDAARAAATEGKQ